MLAFSNHYCTGTYHYCKPSYDIETIPPKGFASNSYFIILDFIRLWIYGNLHFDLIALNFLRLERKSLFERKNLPLHKHKKPHTHTTSLHSAFTGSSCVLKPTVTDS